MELSDNMNLKKHLLHLKAKLRHNERVTHEAKLLQGHYLEKQMEHLCWIEAKLWKLKQELSAILKVINNESNSPSLHKQKVICVPIAELQEKA